MKRRCPVCPYCGGKTLLVPDTVVYKQSYGRFVYVCENYPDCDSYVGTHRDKTPLGKPANEELRKLRNQLHSLIDPFWKCKHCFSRKDVYRRLAEIMGLPIHRTHVGMFDKQQCEYAINYFMENVFLTKDENEIST